MTVSLYNVFFALLGPFMPWNKQNSEIKYGYLSFTGIVSSQIYPSAVAHEYYQQDHIMDYMENKCT